jgi:hypothetical protein
MPQAGVRRARRRCVSGGCDPSARPAAIGRRANTERRGEADAPAGPAFRAALLHPSSVAAVYVGETTFTPDHRARV